MAGLVALLFVALMLTGFVCHILIVIEAFKDEIWKGVLCLICIFYVLYYMFAEYESDKKTIIVALWLIGNVALYSYRFALGSAAGHP